MRVRTCEGLVWEKQSRGIDSLDFGDVSRSMWRDGGGESLEIYGNGNGNGNDASK